MDADEALALQMGGDDRSKIVPDNERREGYLKSKVRDMWMCVREGMYWNSKQEVGTGVGRHRKDKGGFQNKCI